MEEFMNVEKESSMSNELLAASLTNEAIMWGNARDHDQLRSMWGRRITKETHGLNEHQAKALTIAQTVAYVMASQQVTVRTMSEMAVLIRLYTEIRAAR